MRGRRQFSADSLPSHMNELRHSSHRWVWVLRVRTLSSGSFIGRAGGSNRVRKGMLAPTPFEQVQARRCRGNHLCDRNKMQQYLTASVNVGGGMDKCVVHAMRASWARGKPLSRKHRHL